MRYEELGTRRPISKIGLGTWQFGSREWGYGSAYADREAGALVRRALELGITLIDTAEVYGFGRSETIVGAALDGVREQAYVATKLFPVLPVGPVVRDRARRSARRLRTDVIDLYQVHQPNPVVPDSVTMPAMRGLLDPGPAGEALLGDAGVSNYSLARWQAAEKALGRRVLADQVKFSLVTRGPLDDLVPYAQREDRLVIAYSPLEQGLLSGRYGPGNRPSGSVRRANPLFLPENLAAAAPLLDVLRAVAAGRGVTPSQIALAWVIHHRGVVAIPGASGVEQLESNAAAAEITLASDEYTALTVAAKAFRPVTGLAAVPRLIRARRTA